MNYKINLIKKRSFSYRSRRRLYIFFLAYLALCGCAVVVMTVAASIGHSRLASYKSEIAQLEMKAPDQARFARPEQMRQTLEKNVAALSALESALGSHYDIGEVAERIHAVLPKDTYIATLAYDGYKRSLSFDVVIVLDDANPTSSGAALLASFSELFKNGQLGTIASSGSRRDRRNGSVRLIVSFVCKLT